MNVGSIDSIVNKKSSTMVEFSCVYVKITWPSNSPEPKYMYAVPLPLTHDWGSRPLEPE